MFEKVDMSVLTRCEGRYEIRQVFRLHEDFYVPFGKKDYVKLKVSGSTSYKSMTWEPLSIEELHLVAKGIRLELA